MSPAWVSMTRMAVVFLGEIFRVAVVPDGAASDPRPRGAPDM
jgi:hypothetical protein